MCVCVKHNVYVIHIIVYYYYHNHSSKMYYIISAIQIMNNAVCAAQWT